MRLMRDRGLAGPPVRHGRLRDPPPTPDAGRPARTASRLGGLVEGDRVSSTRNWPPVASSPPLAAARSSPSVPTTRRTSAGRGASCSTSSSTQARPRRPGPSRRSPPPGPAGDTATVRRIVAKLEATPPEQALSHRFGRLHPGSGRERRPRHQRRRDDRDRAATPDGRGASTRPTAMLVTEMAKLQAQDRRWRPRTASITREFKPSRTESSGSRSCAAGFAIQRGQRHDLGGGDCGHQPDRGASSTSNDAALNAIRADYHEQFSAVQQVRVSPAASDPGISESESDPSVTSGCSTGRKT